MNTNKFVNVLSLVSLLAVAALSTGCAASFRANARGTIYTQTPTVYVEPAYVPPPAVVVTTVPPPPVLVQPPMLPPPSATVGGSVYVNVPPVTVYGGAYGGVRVDNGPQRPHPRHPCGFGGCR